VGAAVVGAAGVGAAVVSAAVVGAAVVGAAVVGAAVVVLVGESVFDALSLDEEVNPSLFSIFST